MQLQMCGSRASGSLVGGRVFQLDRFGHGGCGARRINRQSKSAFMKVQKVLGDTSPEMDIELIYKPSHIEAGFGILSFIQLCPIPVDVQPVSPVSLVPCHAGHFQIE